MKKNLSETEKLKRDLFSTLVYILDPTVYNDDAIDNIIDKLIMPDILRWKKRMDKGGG